MHHMRASAAFATIALCTGITAQITPIHHWEFDTTFAPPTTGPFTHACGVLHQAGANCGDSLGGGSGGWIDPDLPLTMEARLVVHPGVPGPFPGGVPILAAYPTQPSPLQRSRAALLVDPVTGSVALSGAPTPMLPAGTAFQWHTYRIEVTPHPTWIWQMTLMLDDQPALGPFQVPFIGSVLQPWQHNYWEMGAPGFAPPCSAAVEWDYVTVVQTPDGYGTANSHLAAFFVNRSPSTPAGALGLQGPFTHTVSGGDTLALEWNGPPSVPFALFAGPVSGSSVPFGCAGSIDIGTPPNLLDAGIVFDPTGPLGWLFTLDACGYSKQVLQVPPGLPPGTSLVGLQGLVFQTSGPCPFVLTAAHEIRT